MPTGSKPEIYTTIHKGWRSRIFQISVKAGKQDYDQVSLDTFYGGLQSVATGIRFHHHSMEEQLIHPLLSARMPRGAERLDRQHRHLDHLLDNLLIHFNAIRSQAAGFEKRRELGLELYLAFNPFISFFLIHIDQEEEQSNRLSGISAPVKNWKPPGRQYLLTRRQERLGFRAERFGSSRLVDTNPSSWVA